MQSIRQGCWILWKLAPDKNRFDVQTLRFAAQGPPLGAEIHVAHVNHLPVIQPMPLQLVNEGSTLGFHLIAHDIDGDPVRLSLLQDAATPPGVSFDAQSGYFEWTPGPDTVDEPGADAKLFTFTFNAFDGQATTTQTVQVKVLHVDRPPQIVASSHALVVGQSFSLPVVKSVSVG